MGKKGGIVFSILLIITVAIIGALLFLFSSPVSVVDDTNQTQNDTERECLFDEQCDKVQVSCCPCSSGGEEKCVLKSKINEYELNLSECPDNLICPAVFNCEIDDCICDDGKCSSIQK